MDVVIQSSTGSKFGIFNGNGDGTFKSVNLFDNASSGGGILAADFNGDGLTDILMGDLSSNNKYISYGQVGGSFSAVSTFNTGATANYLSAADFNRDGALDLLSSSGGIAYTSLASTTNSTQLARSDLTTRAAALSALTYLDTVQTRISTELGNIGAAQSRLQSSLANLATLRDNLISARSRIVDADIASESANLLRAQILQQTASSVAGQANQGSRIALTLLKNA